MTARLPINQGVLTHCQICLLLSKGHSCYRPRRTGERHGRSAQCYFVDANQSVLNSVNVKKSQKTNKQTKKQERGKGFIPGLTDITLLCHLEPKRASIIHKLFSLSKEMMSTGLL